MLSAACYFRGNYINRGRALRLLRGICAVPELVPEFWNVAEPIDLPFDQENLHDVLVQMAPSRITAPRSLTFFARRVFPSFLMSVDLRLGIVQWTTPHNSISLEFNTKWSGGERILAQYLLGSLLPEFPDFASIPEWSLDRDRYAELSRSYSTREVQCLFSKKKAITAPFGPYGCLADVQWFNYFGRIYVEAIGKTRLMRAGWARVEEIGDGLACFATDKLQAADSRERRSAISNCIAEFVWSPGCKRDDKLVPDFDFSEQLAALPTDDG
jgi:hypothetical protein